MLPARSACVFYTFSDEAPRFDDQNLMAGSFEDASLDEFMRIADFKFLRPGDGPNAYLDLAATRFYGNANYTEKI